MAEPGDRRRSGGDLVGPSATSSAINRGWVIGPKWSSSASSTNRPWGSASATSAANLDGWSSPTRPDMTTTGTAISGRSSQVRCVVPASNVRGLELRIALEADPGTVDIGVEAVPHVGVESGRIERVQRRLRGVVGQGGVDRREQGPPATGGGDERGRRGRLSAAAVTASIGGTIGSNRTRRENSAGRRWAASSSAVPPIECPKPMRPRAARASRRRPRRRRPRRRRSRPSRRPSPMRAGCRRGRGSRGRGCGSAGASAAATGR